jgi:uncharacterized protein
MFSRNIIYELDKWSKRSNRKPLILRGARQVGKTTAVEMFSKKYKQYLYLNLDRAEDRKLFEQNYSFETLLDAIFLYKDSPKKLNETLLFIDEIQNCPEAVKQLRYFYELAPELNVISAGSLLETIIDKNISFPVGRVEFLVMRPVSFTEYLTAISADAEIDLLNEFPFPEFGHDKLIQHFYRYALIGGMPEVVRKYVEKKDIFELKAIYESLLTSYLGDIEKYSTSDSQIRVIRHIIQHIFIEAGSRIVYQGFGKSNYRSKEISEALILIEKALIIQLMHPVTQTILPLYPDYRKSPRIQTFDTGLVNYFAGIQKDLFLSNDIMSTYHGKIAELVTGQELLSLRSEPLYKLHFWVREKRQSSAEVDFVYQYENILVPVEVKSSSTGHLKSLHQFVNESPLNFGIRVYNGKFQVDELKTQSGKSFRLLNLPFYLINKIDFYIEKFIN